MAEPHADEAPISVAGAPPDERATPLTIALVGQPNVGKSTVFNQLTGLRQHVGNWPGKTVEHKTGSHHRPDATLRIIDLPGVYRLGSDSEEERVVRDFLFGERPDVVILIANATSLERTLYLLTELLELPLPIVLGLNMMDVAQGQNLVIDTSVLQSTLSLPVVPLVASRNEGIDELIDAAVHAASHPERHAHVRGVALDDDLRHIRTEIANAIVGRLPSIYPDAWAALKLLEGDPDIVSLVRNGLPDDVWHQLSTRLVGHDDAGVRIAQSRFARIERWIEAAVSEPYIGQITRTDRIDRVATHPVWGMLLLLGLLGVTFGLTYRVGAPLQRALDVHLVQAAAAGVRTSLSAAPDWVVGLLADGVFGGAGMVLTFVPILVILFAVLGLLEDTGYLARTAFVTDPFLHPMGLHGKSVLPLMLGFGCNVPAVLGARIIEDRRARLLTILLVPFVPCTGRLAVLAFLATAFFGPHATLVSIGLVGLNLIVMASLGALLHRLAFRGNRSSFIMELPLYHAPDLRSIGLFVGRRVWAFVKHAGGIILVMAIVVWALSYLPNGQLEESLLAQLGRALSPVGALLGLDWRPTVALLTSFIAKENTIATLGILYGGTEAGAGLIEQLNAAIEPAAGLAFIATQMLFIPCIATIAVIRKETASWRWTLFSVLLTLAISLAIGALIYQAVRWIG